MVGSCGHVEIDHTVGCSWVEHSFAYHGKMVEHKVDEYESRKAAAAAPDLADDDEK